MKNAALSRGARNMPLGRRLWNEFHFIRNDDSVDAQPGQQPIGTAVVLEKRFGFGWRYFAVNRALEFAGDTGGPDGAVAVDETDPSPHRSTAGTHRRSEWLRVLLGAIGAFRGRINTEIQTIW